METDTPLSRLFNPRRLLLVGATETTLFSAGIARYLLNHGFAERLTMVNPKGRTVFGRPTFPTIRDAVVAGPFDLAIVAIPAPVVVPAIEELGAIGCRLVILESAGFAEIGPEGAALQQLVAAAARRFGVRVLGFNCLGVMDTSTGFASTEVQPESLAPGGVALIAQSGVFGSILLDCAAAMGIRYSKLITMGNRVDLNEADFLEYLADDPATRVVALYLEGVAEGRRFLEAVRRCAGKKPVLVLKSGRSEAGAQAIRSHTASLAGRDEVFAGALRQAGGLRMPDLDTLIETARAFDLCPLPRGDAVAMVTTSGSQAILATDAIFLRGLRLAELSEATVRRVREVAPPWVTVNNPLDLGPSGIYATAIPLLLADPRIDSLLILIAIPWGAIKPAVESGSSMSFLFGDLDGFRRAVQDKPVLISHIGHPDFTALMKKEMGDIVPVYPNSERAAIALSALHRYRAIRE